MLKFLTCFIILISYSNSELILEKVLLLSRHNVRTPLSKSLPQTSPRQWPSWREKSGYLTSKGRLLEGYMGKKPFISGPLKLSKSVVDSFIMEYYEGFPSNEVAWGQIKSEDEWSTILNLSRAYLNAIFTIKLISLDLSKPLLGYLSSFLLNDNSPKVVLLMGHDANIYTVLSAMDFKPHVLHGQYEAVPAGGKIVFQKWFNMLNGSYHMKIEYVYQTADKMRNGVKLSLDEPPEFTTLELKACTVDKDGYCPWNEFKTLLEELIA
ncbi:glucose-1-phosphatase isoform X2 [Bombyx mori]|uniref:Glucose-1-phosphatase n=1 Tax=Bombyx mori TaxID=7091 RepID=A0A8R2M7M9_BOMMO|nr:glucose-1-phosphatase [Bombyx mori]